MKFFSLIEVITAVHLAPYVIGVSEEKGGLMLVAAPGQFKTSAIEYLDNFPHTRLCSNVTVKTLQSLRQDFLSQEIKTLGFPDFDMIYRRHGSVSSQIEGTLMGLMGEGFRNPAFSDQRISVLKARCTVIAGITIKFYEDQISHWIDTGFARRFLWSRYTVKNPEVVEQALSEWKRHHLDGEFIMKFPGDRRIEHSLTKKQAEQVLHQIRFQHDRKLPYITAQRIISVLTWKHGTKKGWDIWNDFSPSLSKDGSQLVL